MLFSRIRNQGVARAETTRLVVGGALSLATWLALSAGCVHDLSGLPRALTAQAAFDPASSRPLVASNPPARSGRAPERRLPCIAVTDATPAPLAGLAR
jgi:hypothetical protein